MLHDEVHHPVGGVRDTHADGSPCHRLPANRISEEVSQFGPQAGAVYLSVRKDPGAPGIGQQAGVGSLVVARSPRERNQEGGNTDHAKFGHRRRPRPADDEVSRSEGGRKVVLVLDDPMLDVRACGISNEPGVVPVPAPQHMVDDDRPTVPILYRLEHGPVDASGTQRPAEDHYEGSVVESMESAGRSSPGTGRPNPDLLPDRVPRHDRPW